MREFFREFLGLGFKYTACMAAAIPLYWLVAWQAPSINDVFNMLNLRLLLAMWAFSWVASWLMIRE